jgi:septal ring factor EnvC (AmiA/AmiB activator)
MANDHLGWDVGPGNNGNAPTRPAAMLDGKIGKVEKLEAMVARQQKQIEVLTAQLREQGSQIQKVSAQLEASKQTPRIVSNP